MAVTHCCHCGDEACPHCEQCQVVHYCSRECKDSDWPFHKLLCKQWASFKDKPESKQELRRVILLPEHSENPVFHWMPMDVREPEEDAEGFVDENDFASDLGVPGVDPVSGYTMPADDENSGMGNAMPQYITLVVGKRGRGDLLDHSITMMVKDSSFGHRPNKCVSRLLGGAIALVFRGPMIFLRTTKVESPSHTLDIDASDLTLALDGLVEFAKKREDPIGYHVAGGLQPKKTTAVKVNVAAPFYEEVDILRTNKIFQSDGQPSELSKQLDLPLLTIPSSTATSERRSMGPSEAPSLLLTAYLHVCVNARLSKFGEIPAKIKNNAASVIVARADKAPLLTSGLITLCDFIKNDALPVLQAARAAFQNRQEAMKSVVQMWQQRAALKGAESDEEYTYSEDSEDSDEDVDPYNDLADVRAKISSLSMATTHDARSGMGYL